MEESGEQIISDELMNEIIPEDNEIGEVSMFTSTCKKISRWGIQQERQLILSSHSIYIVYKNKLASTNFIKDLKHIIKNLKNNEILLYFRDESDLLLVLKEREVFYNLLKLRFASLVPNFHLKVYGIPQDIKQYRSLNGKKSQAYAFENEPEEKYRLFDEDIQTQKMIDEKIKNEIQQSDKDFIFEGRDSIALGPNMKEEERIHEGSMLVGGQSGLDNLEIHFNEMMENFQKNENISKNVKRKLTVDEESELRSTTLVKTKTQIQNEKPVAFSDFNFLMVIGRGTFGKVFLAELKKNKKLFAIKSIRKDILLQHDQVENTILEKDIMLECDNPFLVSMDYLFQNDLRLYFVMPFIRGGELYKVFQSEKRFKEVVVKFYAAQMIIAIGYLHLKGIVHRDLKLENILIDQDGYIKIIDYGLAKMLDENQESTSFCGTPEYLAPEMINQTGHDKAVDWWALGILIYEMLIGVTPFFNKNKSILLTKIQTAKVVFPDRKKYKIDYSDEIVDLILKLLDKDKSKRLGHKDDFFEVLSHPFFADIDIEGLEKKLVVPPFKPNFGNKDFTQFYNVSNSKSDMGDTYIPRDNRKIIEQNSNAFENFNSKIKK